MKNTGFILNTINKKELLNLKGKDLIDFIIQNGLENFELRFIIEEDKTETFPIYRIFKLVNVSDIGYSEKEIILEGEEIK